MVATWHHTDFKFHRLITQIGCYWGGGGHTELYLVEGDRLGLIDTGVATTPADYVEPALNAIGRTLSDVEVVINTHGHHDHAGGNRVVYDAGRAEIWIHEADAAITQDPDLAFETFFAREQRLVGQLAKLEAARLGHAQTAGRPAPIARRFADGDVLDLGRGVELRVVHTPGHTLGCCTLVWDHEGIAFSGDSVLGRGSREGGLPLIFYPDHYRRSLEVIRQLRPRALCLGHHYRTLRQSNESIRFGDTVPKLVDESAEIQAIVERAVDAALAELGREATFDRVGRLALHRIEDHMPLNRDQATGWPQGALAALSGYWGQVTGNPV